MKNQESAYIRWERRNVPILQSLKKAQYSKGYCEVKFTPQFVNKHWDNL